MPKTNIYLARDTTVAVGWSKHAQVAQIGVHTDDGEKSLFVDLTARSQINALIRALRRARDDAFGRDE